MSFQLSPLLEVRDLLFAAGLGYSRIIMTRLVRTQLPLAVALVTMSLAYGQTNKGVSLPREADSLAEAERVAIVVGVSEYSHDSELENLPLAKDDAEDMAAALRGLGYTVTLLPNARAGEIVRAIRESRKLISGANSTILFYRSGHGASGANRENYLMTHGASRERMQHEALSLTELQKELRDTKAQREVIWIDACRTVPAEGKKSPPDSETFAEMKAASDIRILLSSSFGDASWEYPELKHGAFTYHLLKALTSGSPAYRADGVITFSGLSNYVRSETRKWTFEHHHTQVPVEAGAEVTGDFLLASSVVSRSAELTVPKVNLPAERERGAALKSAVDALHRRDYQEALVGFEALARANDPIAESYLGNMSANGQGVEKSDIEAVRWFRLSAEQGLAAGQMNLGGVYASGRGVPKSDAEALKWYRQAADHGDAHAQFNVGLIYDKGRGVAKSETEAVKYYQLAAAQGLADAQHNLGVMYENGRGAPRNYADALKWYRLAADQGLAAAQYGLAGMYEGGRGVPKSDVEAAKWFRLAADQGEPNAEMHLGVMYATGRGVAQSDSDAVKWLRLAADQGDVAAQVNLGALYAAGQGVPKSNTEAAKWYQLAAAQGNEVAKQALARLAPGQSPPPAPTKPTSQAEPAAALKSAIDALNRKDYAEAKAGFEALAGANDARAQYYLGFMYDRGQGVRKDDAEAAKWYRLAADQGYADAQLRVGLMYYTGGRITAFKPNYVEALKWYRLAADQGQAAAQHNLGVMYSLGQGVTKDPKEAAKWFQLAAGHGGEPAKQALPGQAAAPNPPPAPAKPPSQVDPNDVMELNFNAALKSALDAMQRKDYAEAKTGFEALARANDPQAQFFLGIMNVNGQGVPKSDIEAVKWYRLSADQG